MMRHVSFLGVKRKKFSQFLSTENKKTILSATSTCNLSTAQLVVEQPVSKPHQVHHQPRITINISGQVYETYSTTLECYPNTLLGDAARRSQLVDKKTGEIFINRNRVSFEAILFFYQSKGNLLRPASILMSDFEAECRWYQLPDDAIKRMKQRESFLYKKKRDLPGTHLNDSLLYNCWMFLDRPREFKYPWISKSYFCFYYTAVLFSVMLFCFETELPLHSKETRPYKRQFQALLLYGEVAVNILFITELSFRFMVSPDQKRFFKKPTNVFEFISILIFVFVYGLDSSEPRKRFLYISRMMYALRLTRLGRISKVIKTSFTVFLEAVEDVLAVLFTMLIIIIFGGTVMYYFESGIAGTKFKSIPDSMWWAMQTSLCLGYGDIIPQTFLGRYFGLLVLYGGVVVVMILILSLGGRVFDMYIKEFDETCGGFLPDLKEKEDYEIHYRDEDDIHIIKRRKEN